MREEGEEDLLVISQVEEVMDVEDILLPRVPKRAYNPEGALLVGDEEFRRETKRVKFS